MKTFRLYALILLCAIAAFPLCANDFGLVLNQNFAVTGNENKKDISYEPSIVPWFSALPAPGIDVYASAGFTAQYERQNQDGKWSYIPELFRTELRWRFEGGSSLRAGRMEYSDPLDLVAGGLFDGIAFYQNLGGGQVSTGVWYTGLLYKKSANITVTKDDLDAYYAKLDWAEFADTYFASRRLLAAIDYEHHALADILRLRVSLAGQFDLNSRNLRFHSQYLTVKAAVPVQAFVFTLGGSLETEEYNSEFKVGLLGDLGIAWALPTSINDRLSLNARFSSGVKEDTSLSAFVPLNSEPQGHVLKAKITGLSVIEAEYTARLHRTLSLSGNFLYFIRSDKGTWQDWPVTAANYFLGGELYGRAVWSPLSDINLIFGGGAFIPAMGNAGPDEKVRWKLEIGATIAIY